MAAPELTDERSPLEVLRLYRPHSGSVVDLVASRAEADPRRTMLTDRDRSWTWAEAQEEAARLATHLADRGVGEGDRVVLFGPNSGWHVLTLIACARLGAIFVPLNPELRGDDLAYVLKVADPRVVLADTELLQDLPSTVEDRPREAIGPNLLADAAAMTKEHGSAQSPCVIIFTSGTTGFPKAAVHSQHTVVLAGEATVERMHLQPEDRMLAILPLFHVNALFYSVTGCLAAGASLVVEPRFSASRFWDTVQRHRITQTNMIEAVGAILLNRPQEESPAEHPLRKIYGIRQALSERFRARFGVPHLVGGYGMTEIPGILATPYSTAAREGSMGLLGRHPDPSLPWAECRVVDDDGQDVPNGTPGELWVRTPTIMLGYFRDDEETQRNFHDEWFRTGDLVRRDDDGWYYFVARKKDIIRRRGENVSGAELDRVLSAHPEVVLAAAVGVPADLGDEEILALVTVRDGAQGFSLTDLAEHCRRQLPAIKVPRYYAVVDDLPLTPSGKVAKHRLREREELLSGALDTSR